MVKKLLSTGNKIFSREQSSILSAAAVITASSLISALFGLLRNRLLISRFFASEVLQQQLDAYWVAFRLPELVFQLLVIGSLSAAFIPVYSAYRQKDQKDASYLASSMMNIVLVVFGVLSLLIFIFAEEFNSAITSVNFSVEQIKLAAQLSRIMLLAQFFFAISNFLTGIIQAQQRFLIPALSPLAYNIGIILGIILLSPIMGIYGAAVGVVIGALLHLLMQLPLAFRLGFTYRPVWDFKHPGVKEMIKLMPPRTLAISVNQIELFASVYFATALSPGSLTIISIAQQLMSAPIRVFSVPIGQASLPFLSKDVASGKLKEFKDTLISSLHHVLFLAFPAGMLLLILRIPLVRLAYGSPSFPWSATLLTGKAVALMSLTLFAQGGIHILVRGFYALHNTKVPFVIALLSVAINITLSYLAVFGLGWGVLGLAAAMSVAGIIQFTLLLILLMKEVGGFRVEEFIVVPVKIMLATAVMGVGLWVPMRLLDQFVFDTTRVIPLVMLTTVVSIIGGSIYLLLAYILGIPETYAYARLIKRVGNWREVLVETEEVIESTSSTEETRPLS